MLPARVGMMAALGIFKQITRLATCKGESIAMGNNLLHSIEQLCIIISLIINILCIYVDLIIKIIFNIN